MTDLDEPTSRVLAAPMFSHHVDVFAVADYLISLDEARPEPDVTPMKLAKLLYLAQSNYLASTGRRMFDEPVEAWEHGPVVHSEWKRHRGGQIIAIADPDPARGRTSPPDDVSEFLDAIWAMYGEASAADLRRLTHDQAPWRDHYRQGEHRTVVPDEEMASYFREHVSVEKRVFHPGVVLVPDGFLDESDAEAFAGKYAEFTRR